MKQAKQIALGTGVALAVYLALQALASLLVVRGTVSEENVGICVWAFACLAAFAGAKAAAYRAADALLPSAAASAAFWMTVQLLGFLAGGALDTARSLALILPVLAGGTLAYLIRPGKGKSKRGKRGTRRSRK